MDKLSVELSKWRADRPDEWIMDTFIREAKKLESTSTCTANERKFLDEIREKGVLFKYKTASNAIGIGSTIIDQVDFKTNIENLTNEIH